MTLTELFVYIRDGGTLAVLLLVIVGGMKGWYIWDREAKELRERIRKQEQQIERLESAVIGSTALARRSLTQAERARSADADEVSQDA